jgi:hypothetical protein
MFKDLKILTFSDDEARSKIDTIDDDNKSIGEQSQRSQSNTVSSSQRFPSRNLSSHPNNQNNSPNTNISSQTPSGNTTLEPVLSVLNQFSTLVLIQNETRSILSEPKRMYFH